MKLLRKMLLWVVVVGAVVLLLRKLSIADRLRNIFVAKEVVIDQTPVVLKEIRSIGQLVTYTALDEIVVDSTILTPGSKFVNAFNHLSPFPVLPSADKRLVLVVKGKVLAGVDLATIDPGSVSIAGDTVTLKMPHSRILDVIVNPNDFETFDESGQWTGDEVTAVKVSAKRRLQQRAVEQQIVEKANVQARVILEQFIGKLGFSHVVLL